VITLPQELVEVSQWILFWKENAGNCYKHLKFTTAIMKRNVYKEKRLSILVHRETPQEHVKVTK
jgi:quinolinate synthase